MYHALLCMKNFIMQGSIMRKTNTIPVLSLVFFISLFYAFYTGFRLPTIWTINYYIPTFFDGFFRRSAAGTLLYPFGALRFNYYFIMTIQILILLMLIAVLFLWMLRSNAYFQVLVIFYLLSPIGGYLFHEIGYIDQLLYLFLFIVLKSKNHLLNLILLCASLFFHEMAAFTIIPIYLAALILRKEKTSIIISHGAVLVFVFTIIYLFFQTVEQNTVNVLLAKLNKAQYEIREDYYKIFSIRFNGRRKKMFYNYHNAVGLISCTMLAMIAAYTQFKARKSINLKILIQAGAVFVACIAPLFLGLFGWDTSRWIFLSVSSALIMFYLLRDKITLSTMMSITLTFLIITTCMYLQYFDGETPRMITEDFIEFFRSDFFVMVKTIPAM